jgi:formylglycine-generating enzyme required for sulfatase activity
MSDTVRGVSWALERPCPLRFGADWPRPDVTRRQLADVRAYARGLLRGFVLDDVCVTSWRDASDGSGASVELPHSGFRVSLALAPLGGEAAVRAACGACEANLSRDGEPALANCHGFLVMDPDGEELESHLSEKVRRKGLEADVARLFPPTRPLWYGFWIGSRLRPAQCELLLALLDVPRRFLDPWDGGYQDFLAALRAAVACELPLHVHMAPPGHVDLGWETVFPHCPRCTAPAPVPRWRTSYPDEPLDCRVCGHRYSPAATHKTERTDEDAWGKPPLEKVLGAAEAEAFRRRFLARRCRAPGQIENVLDRAGDGPLRRRINDLRRREEAVRRSLPARAPAPGPLPPALTVTPGGGVALRLRLVPEGEFLMGSAGPPDEVGPEGPQHRVRIARPFYLGEFPVTRAQFAAVLGRYRSRPGSESGRPARHAREIGVRLTRAVGSWIRRFQGGSGLPAGRVSWLAAQEFCLQLSQAAGFWIRLPSEAEWEYACRAGTTSRYHWGDEVTGEQVNCKFEGSGVGRRGTGPNAQGRFPPNAWGLYDLHGNVDEWCEDEWHDHYDGAPADGSPRVTPVGENVFRVVRGGSHWHYATACTSATRQMQRADSFDGWDVAEADNLPDEWFGGMPPVGFRIACDADVARP